MLPLRRVSRLVRCRRGTGCVLSLGTAGWLAAHNTSADGGDSGGRLKYPPMAPTAPCTAARPRRRENPSRERRPFYLSCHCRLCASSFAGRIGPPAALYNGVEDKKTHRQGESPGPRCRPRATRAISPPRCLELTTPTIAPTDRHDPAGWRASYSSGPHRCAHNPWCRAHRHAWPGGAALLPPRPRRF